MQGKSEEIVSDLAKESAEYFSSFAQILGYPKSVGQIYGLLFMSIEPIPMEAVIKRLGISKGSASQGLNVLKGVGAVRSLRIEGERCEHYEADFDVSHMVQHFVEEKLSPRIENGEDRIDRMIALVDQFQADSTTRTVAVGRLKALRKWQNRTKKIIPMIRRFFWR